MSAVVLVLECWTLTLREKPLEGLFWAPRCPCSEPLAHSVLLGTWESRALHTALEPSGRAASPPTVSPHPPPPPLGSSADPGGRC